MKALDQAAKLIYETENTLEILAEVLEILLDYCDLEVGWILLMDETGDDLNKEVSFALAAQVNLPDVLGRDLASVWEAGCECQDLCAAGDFPNPVDRVPCARFLNPAAGKSAPADYHVSIPIGSGRRLQGVMNLYRADGRPIDLRKLDQLAIIGAHIGTALERLRAATSKRDKRLADEQAALLEFTSHLLRNPDLDQVVSYLVKEVVRLLKVDACGLLLPDEKPGYLIFKASAGWHSDPVVEQRRVSSGMESGSGKAMLDQIPIFSIDSTDRDHIPNQTVEWLESEEFEAAAIFPIIVRGRSIGALVLTMYTQREFSDDDIRFIRLLANQAAIAIDNFNMQKEEQKRQLLEEELRIGQRIQLSLLPESCPMVDGWECATFYQPARHVGGDFYDFFQLTNEPDLLGVVIGDVVDKGIPASLFMAASRTLIRSTAMAGRSPADTLAEANKLIQQDNSANLFISTFYGVLNLKTGLFRYANAGHNPPLWFRSDRGELDVLSGRGVVLCVQEEIALEEQQIYLNPGDSLVLYTDGLIDAVDPSFKQFGLEMVKSIIADEYSSSPEQIISRIREELELFCQDADQFDDIALVVIKRM